jgi:hypothetical protein
MLKPYHGEAKTERTTLPPLPVVMRDGEEEFEVESVVSYRRHRGKPQYLIKWLRWPLSESTWENEKDLTHCDSALKHFHEEAGRVVPWDFPSIATPLIDRSLNSTLPFYDYPLPSSLYSSPMSPLIQRIDPCCLVLRANYAPLEGCDYYL